MSMLRAVARKNGIATGTTLKTLLQLLAAANQRVKIIEVGISFHGISNTAEPIQTDLVFQSTAGTMTALTAVTIDQDLTETIQTTAQHTATGEPTAGNIVATWAVHPQTGLVWQVPKGDEIIIKGGGRLGLCTTAPVTVNVDAYIKFEE